MSCDRADTLTKKKRLEFSDSGNYKKKEKKKDAESNIVDSDSFCSEGATRIELG